TVLATILPEAPNTQVIVNPTTTTPDIKTNTPELTLPDTQSTGTQNNPSPVPLKDNAPATSSPAPTARQDSVVVSLVQEPSAQTGGVVNVQVPQQVISSTGGFSFTLPQSLAVTRSASLVV